MHKLMQTQKIIHQYQSSFAKLQSRNLEIEDKLVLESRLQLIKGSVNSI